VGDSTLIGQTKGQTTSQKRIRISGSGGRRGGLGGRRPLATHVAWPSGGLPADQTDLGGVGGSGGVRRGSTASYRHGAAVGRVDYG